MAERAITGKQRPVEFVSTVIATTAYQSHVAFALWFPDDDAEVIPTPGARTGEVYSHIFRLTLRLGLYNELESPSWQHQVAK
jgi:hypothetical protein